MISKGKIAQFRSVDLDTSSDDSLLVDKDGNIDADVGMQLISRRRIFGGGFLWEKSTDIIKLTMFWRTLSIPKYVRVHLFGTTEAKNIGCLVLECEVPSYINSYGFNALQRIPIDIKVHKLLEFTEDIEAYTEPEHINI